MFVVDDSEIEEIAFSKRLQDAYAMEHSDDGDSCDDRDAMTYAMAYAMTTHTMTTHTTHAMTHTLKKLENMVQKKQTKKMQAKQTNQEKEISASVPNLSLCAAKPPLCPYCLPP